MTIFFFFRPAVRALRLSLQWFTPCSGTSSLYSFCYALCLPETNPAQEFELGAVQKPFAMPPHAPQELLVVSHGQAHTQLRYYSR